MRADGHFTSILLIILTSVPIILAAVISVWLGISESISNYVNTFFKTAWPFVIIGVIAGILAGGSAAINTYKECHSKVDAFSWPSAEAKYKAQKNLEGMFIIITVMSIFFVGFVGIEYLFIKNFLRALAHTLNIASTFDIMLLTIVVITEIPTLLIDVIFGRFLQGFFQRLSDLVK